LNLTKSISWIYLGNLYKAENLFEERMGRTWMNMNEAVVHLNVNELDKPIKHI